MALTPQEFETIKNYRTKTNFLMTQVTALNATLIEVERRTNPADSLNQTITFQQAVDLFGALYAQSKTNIVTAFQALP